MRFLARFRLPKHPVEKCALRLPGWTACAFCGAMIGTNGNYVTVQNADGSGQSTYNDTYQDGWSDQGQSLWNADGSSSWSSRTDGPGAAFYSYQGSFNADGSGTNHTATSDGYITDNIYHADGSGSGRIQGPDPALPATLTWDIYGNTTIHYADSSVEYDPGWGYYGGTLVGTSVGAVSSGGAASSGTTSSSSSIPR